MDAQSLIDCWEHGRRRHSLDRGLLMYAAAAPGADVATLADRTLGERNSALLRLRQKLFGDALKSCVDCPDCGERLEFVLKASTLLARASTVEGSARDAVDFGGIRVRMPTTRDLASLVDEPDETHALRKLLKRLWTAGEPGDVRHDDLARLFDDADTCFDLTVDLECPACAHEWNCAFDVPAFLWDEIEAHARRLLDEVHVLAHSYGWSEQEILRLSEARRQAYIARALG